MNVVSWNTRTNINVMFDGDRIVLIDNKNRVYFSDVNVAVLSEFSTKTSNPPESERVRYLHRSTLINPRRKNLIIAVSSGKLTVEKQDVTSGFVICRWIKDSRLFFIAGIHSQTPNYFDSVMNMHHEIKKLPSSEPLIVAGDFNLNAELAVRGNSRSNFEKFWTAFSTELNSAYHVAKNKPPNADDTKTLLGSTNDRMIDYIFFSRNHFSVQAADVGKEVGPSDHCPVWADLIPK